MNADISTNTNNIKNGEGKLVIGLTGGIGTGKSTAAEYLVSKGMTHIDADAISRKLTEKIPDEENPVLIEIGEAFAPAPVLREDGSLDRKAMADIVFHDPARKKLLEEILFREIMAEINRRIDEAEGMILLDVPLLFETGLDSLCDRVILITADRDTRIRRVTQRDGCSPEDVEARIRNQMSDEEKAAKADAVVDNSGSREDLYGQLDEIIRGLKPQAA